MSDKLIKIHQDSLREFARIQSALRDERLLALKDRRFYTISGAQWEGNLGKQFKNKPRLEVNKIHLAVIRIINEYRNNRVTVDFISKAGKKNDVTADTLDGLYRATEQDSCAEEAYDNAFEEAVGGGYGAWRLRADYEDDDGEQQKIYIEPIYDADSTVFFDLDAKKQDKSDAKSCYVISSISMDAYKEEWGDDLATWPKIVHQDQFDWNTKNIVYIAEKYQVEKVKEKIYIYETFDGKEERHEEVDEELKIKLLASGSTLKSTREITKKKVHKYILSGGRVLKDCGIVAGENIPIVPMYGKRWYIDNIERAMGHVRLCKDVQRLKNMQLSKLAEISSLSPISKPIFSPQQVAGHERRWEKENIKNYPYMIINPVTDADGKTTALAPMAYTKSPEIPKAMDKLLQITEADMKDLLGNPQAGEEIHTNVSGKAVELVQSRLDMQAFIYISNMSKAIKRSGEIWLSMSKDVFVEDNRELKVVGKQNESSTIKVAKPVIDEETNEIVYENDISTAKYDVTVSVGPSSSSKRAATVRSLTGMMSITQDPEAQQVLGAMAMMNMEGEGIEDVRDYYRQKLLRMGVVKPNEEEAKQLAAEAENQQPTPNDQYLLAAANKETADANKAEADRLLSIAKIDKVKAETIDKLADAERKDEEAAFQLLDRIHEPVPTEP